MVQVVKKNAMRLLIVTRDFKPKDGGVAEFTHELARHMAALECEVCVLAPEREGLETFAANAAYAILPYSEPEPVSRMERVLLKKDPMADIITQAVDSLKSDAIVVNHYDDVGYLAFLVSQKIGIPYFICAHGREVRRPLNKRELAKAFLPVFNHAACVFCNSPYTQGELAKKGVALEKIKVVTLGVSLDAYPSAQENNDASEGVTFFTVTRLVPRKGIDRVMEAIHARPDALGQAIYRIAGQGPDMARLRELAASLGIERQVKFLGYISDEEKIKEYAACDVFLMPCRETADGDVEGFGLVFLEANACWRPVIAGRSGGVEAAVADGVSGILVNPDHVEDIADAMTRLAGDALLRTRMGRDGRSRVEAHFTWQHTAEKYVEIIRGLL